MPERYTLHAALDAVGSKLYGKNWTGEEANARGPLRPQIVAGWAEMGADDRPIMTPELREQIERFRAEPRVEVPPDERNNWDRREEARQALRELVRSDRVIAYLDFSDGKRKVIEPAQWEAIDGPLWLNYASSLGGFSDRQAGIEGISGEVWLNREQLDQYLPGIKPPRHSQAERKADTRRRKKELQQRAEEIWQSNPHLPKANVAKMLAESGEYRNFRQAETKTIMPETVERIIRVPKGLSKRRRKVPKR
jgi:hypothetical protein